MCGNDHFGIASDIYKQEGLAMGSPLSSLLANVYMEYVEEMSLGSISQRQLLWLRYLDDKSIFWLNQEDVRTLLDHVNSVRPFILFTMEKEQDNRLSFLEV